MSTITTSSAFLPSTQQSRQATDKSKAEYYQHSEHNGSRTTEAQHNEDPMDQFQQQAEGRYYQNQAKNFHQGGYINDHPSAYRGQYPYEHPNHPSHYSYNENYDKPVSKPSALSRIFSPKKGGEFYNRNRGTIKSVMIFEVINLIFEMFLSAIEHLFRFIF